MNKPPDSKIFKLKKWLTLPDAAKHISSVCNEEVTEADILRLALDGHLKLSVNFVNQTKAQRGDVVGCEGVKWREFPREFCCDVSNLAIEENGELLRYMESLKINDTQFLNFNDEVTTIEGVWDLPMIGNGRLDIENKYQRLTGGLIVGFQDSGGPVVEVRDGVMYQLGEKRYANLCYSPETIAKIGKLKRLELSKSNNRRKEKLLILRRKELELFKTIEDKWSNLEEYFRGFGLPEDSVLVLRPKVLREFEQLMLDNETGGNTVTKVHGNTERHAANREQVLGAALSVLARWSDECKNGVGKIEATKIRALIESRGYKFWHEDGEPPMSTGEIEKLIRTWLKKTRV